ncbi:hypothetical protein R6Q59_009285 [Mikania micrantha]
MAAAAAMMFTSSSSCPWRPSLISFCRPSPVQSACFPRVVVIVRAQTNRRMGKSESSEQKWVAKGLITESLPNGMFWVRLENGDVVLGYISGKIRRNSIRMLPGDKVKIEVSRPATEFTLQKYSFTHGRSLVQISYSSARYVFTLTKQQFCLLLVDVDQIPSENFTLFHFATKRMWQQENVAFLPHGIMPCAYEKNSNGWLATRPVQLIVQYQKKEKKKNAIFL